MKHGEFSGDPESTWLTQEGTPDRQMRVLQDFSFTDPSLKVWPAPRGSVVDGASIPRALWTIVGSPYTGDYRRASIVHDIACDNAEQDTKKRRAADRMFFHACRTGGCSIWESIVLYLGVRIGAAAKDVPSWHAAISIEAAGPRLRRSDEELELERDFQRIADRVLAPGETDDPAELEKRTDAALAVTVGLKASGGKGRSGVSRSAIQPTARRRRPRRS